MRGLSRRRDSRSEQEIRMWRTWREKRCLQQAFCTAAELKQGLTSGAELWLGSSCPGHGDLAWAELCCCSYREGEPFKVPYGHNQAVDTFFFKQGAQ